MEDKNPIIEPQPDKSPRQLALALISARLSNASEIEACKLKTVQKLLEKLDDRTDPLRAEQLARIMEVLDNLTDKDMNRLLIADQTRDSLLDKLISAHKAESLAAPDSGSKTYKQIASVFHALQIIQKTVEEQDGRSQPGENT